MKLHLYQPGSLTATTISIDDETSSLRSALQVGADEIIYLLDSDEGLDADATVIEVFGKKPGVVIKHHCREVHVNISYAGSVKHITVKPAVTVQRVLGKAIKKFEIDASQAADLALRVPGRDEDLATTTPIGSLTLEKHCDLDLDLVHAVRNQG